MLKATMTKANGRKVLILGLSFGNLDRFKSAPLDTFIDIRGEEMGLPIDVLLFSGETETAMAAHMNDMIGPDTVLRVDPKLAS